MNMLTRVKQLALHLGLSVVSVLLTLLLIELILRCLPVNSGLAWQPVNDSNPVQHLKSKHIFVWSQGWNFSVVNRGRINNAGFINDMDYDVHDPRVLLAVIGDSYIEAEMVPFAETVQGRLAGHEYRIYSFAASGAPLSQYLIWAQHAVYKYGAKYLIITIVGNDFDESLLKYKSAPGHHYYAPNANGGLKLVRIDYTPSQLRRILRMSALARYLLMNIQLQGGNLLNFFVVPNTSSVTYGNTAADSNRLPDSKMVVDTFLSDLRNMTGLASDHILLVMDGLRYPNQAEGAKNSYFVLMRTYLIQQARAKGFETIDMDQWFFSDFLANKRLFHIKDDGHWNGYGHAVAAQAIRASKVFTHFRSEYERPSSGLTRVQPSPSNFPQ
jgi:hypothetical protein